MTDNEEENGKDSKVANISAKKVIRAVIKPAKWLIIAVLIFVLVVLIAGAVIKDIIRIGDAKNSNDPDDKNYRAYGPGAYSDSITIDAENGTITAGMTAQEMWDNDGRYREYLYTVDELEYLLNAQFVTQYPYIASAEGDELNGTIRFYRNNSEDPMVYVSQDTLQSYVDSYNAGTSSALDSALKSFTLNEDGSIQVAFLTETSHTVTTNDPVAVEDALQQISGSSSSTSGENSVVRASESVLSTTNIPYLSSVQNYVLPFNLLWSIVVMGHSDKNQAIELATSIADMAYDGEISLIIDDNNSYSEEVETYTYTLTDCYTGSLAATINEEKITEETVIVIEKPGSGGNNTIIVGPTPTDRATDNTRKSNRTIEKHQYSGGSVLIDEKHEVAQYETVCTEIHNDNRPSVKIKKIVSWCAIYENDATYTTNTITTDDDLNASSMEDITLGEVTYSGAEAFENENIESLQDWKKSLEEKYKDSTEEVSEDITVTYTYSIEYEGTIIKEQKYTNITVNTASTYKSSGYMNGTVTSPVFNEEILEKFNDPSVSSVRSTIVDTDDDGWFIPALEANDDTANMVDLMKYIFNRANGDEPDEDFESIWDSMIKDSGFNTVSSTSLMDFIRQYVRSWEGCTEISSDGTKYKIESDGYGNATVGYGVDIANSGFQYRFEEKGYPTYIGGWVDIEFVDELELEELQDGYDDVTAETAGLDLTGYQIAALVSRYYNAGIDGWKKVCNEAGGKNFVQAYGVWWSNSKTEEYFGQSNNSSIYSESLYTNYMYQPNTSKGQFVKGLENRRKSEWLLFTTGYADRLDIQWSDNMYGGDIVSVATRIHEYIRENKYAYSCSHNVYGGYVNTCEKNEESHFGKDLNSSTIQDWYEMRCIDCSAFVSWVLYESGIDIGRQTSDFFYGGGYTSSYTQYNWQKITNWNDLQPGDILVKSGHVEIYIGNGYTLGAGCTDAIRREKSYGNLSSIKNDFAFAVRVTK